MDPQLYGKLLTHHQRGYGVDVEALHDRFPLRRSARKECSDPTSDGQVSVLKCHPWIGMLTHTVLEDL